MVLLEIQNVRIQLRPTKKEKEIGDKGKMGKKEKFRSAKVKL